MDLENNARHKAKMQKLKKNIDKKIYKKNPLIFFFKRKNKNPEIENIKL